MVNGANKLYVKHAQIQYYRLLSVLVVQTITISHGYVYNGVIKVALTELQRLSYYWIQYACCAPLFASLPFNPNISIKQISSTTVAASITF